MSATNRLIIVASIEGVKNVVAQISGIGDAAAGTEKKASLLRNSLGALFGAAAVSQIARYSDQFTNLQNKLKIVTSGTEELRVATEKLFSIAQQTRSSFADTGKLYQRVALSGKELGNSQETNLRLTELLNKAIIISGSSSIEASNAMIQLSQGLAKGTLNGDELRSVLEQLPNIADLIAKRMGVTRGALRDLGAEGKITARIVQEALLSAGADIDATFARLTPTIGQAFQVLSDKIMKMIGDFNTATGVMTGVANAIILISNNLESLAISAAGAGAAFALIRIAQFNTWLGAAAPLLAGMSSGIGGIIAPATNLSLIMSRVGLSFQKARAEMLLFVKTNPFIAIIAGLAILLPLIYTFSDQIKLTTDGSYTLKEAIDGVASGLSAGLVPLLELLGQLLGVVFTAFQAIVEVVFSLLTPFQGFADLIQANSQGLISTATYVHAFTEALVIVLRVGLTPLIVAFRLWIELYYALGGVTEATMASVRAQTDAFLDFSNVLNGAAGRVRETYQAGLQNKSAMDQSATAANGATTGLGNYSNAAGNATGSTKGLSGALVEKKSYLMEADILYTKVAYGVTSYKTALDGTTVAINGQNAAHVSNGVSMKMSADGINAITASEAYYAEKTKQAKAETGGLKDNVSKLSEVTPPAQTALEGLGTKTKTAGEALKVASEGAGSLKENVLGANEALQSSISSMNAAAAAANSLAAAYREAAAAAAALAAAKSSSGSDSPGQSLNHNGGMAGEGPIRYHSGGVAGLQPDEVSAVLQKGEEVLTSDDPRHRSNLSNYMTGEPDRPQATITNGGMRDDKVMLDRTWTEIADYLRQMNLTLEDLGTANATNVASGGSTRRGYATVFDSYNAFDPFAQAISNYDAQGELSQLIGGNDQRSDGMGGMSDQYAELKKFQEIFRKSFTEEWVTEQDLENVLAQAAKTPPSQKDFQTPTPFQQGYQGPQASGWQPSLVATQMNGNSTEPKIEVKMEIKAQDANSFRQNAATIDAQVYSAVERARRRLNR